jgi:EAL domain-containing protein (putative c-di-GMP-specific phosphodiesterase class I)
LQLGLGFEPLFLFRAERRKHLKLKEMVDETLKSGIPPIVFDYQDVRFFASSNYLVRTAMVINSLDLGTLTPKEYRFVARRTKQGEHMVRRHIEKLVRLIPKLIEKDPAIECFTIPTYAKMLKGGALSGMLFDALTLYPETPPSKICIELSADILYEEMEEAVTRVAELREMGVKVAICEVGDEFCPVFRLASLPVDYAFIDEYATASLDREDAERVAGSLVKYLHYLDVKVIAPELDSEAKIAGAKAVECDGYTVVRERPKAEELPIEPETAENEAGEEGAWA